MGQASAEQQQTKQEYQLLLAAFEHLLDVHENSAEKWETIEEIITHRSAFLIDRLLVGLAMNFDWALSILRKQNSFTTKLEAEQRVILVAAIDNLVDFAAAQESQLWDELSQLDSSADREQKESLVEKYNLNYALQENQEVVYASQVAAWWMMLPNEAQITYMTQGDERVRAWHLSLDGISYLKSEFPAELIPPIEWGCRCFLVSDGFDSVLGTVKNKGDNKQFTHPVFSESLSKGGKIFSEAHPYFQKPIPHQIATIANRIKNKLYAKNIA